MRRLREIVDGRNAIVEGLDEDRLRSANAARFKTRGVFKKSASLKMLFLSGRWRRTSS